MGADHICLGIDASAPSISAAVLVNGTVEAEAAAEGGPSGEVLLLLVDRVLKQAQIQTTDVQRVAVGIGPGSFTGIRNGVATAQGFAFPSRVPVYGVSSLLALSDPAPLTFQVVLIAANQQENFGAVFCRSGDSDEGISIESGALSFPKSFQSESDLSQLEDQQAWQHLRRGARESWSVEVIQPLVTPGANPSGPSLAGRMARLTYRMVQPSAQGMGELADRRLVFQSSIAGRDLVPVYAKPVNAKTLVERGIITPNLFAASGN